MYDLPRAGTNLLKKYVPPCRQWLLLGLRCRSIAFDKIWVLYVRVFVECYLIGISSIKEQHQVISSCPSWTKGHRGRQLSQYILTRSPFRFLPALGQSPLKGPQVTIFMNIVLAIFVDLDIGPFSISRRTGLEYFAVHLLDLPLQTIYPVVNGLFLLCWSFFRR